MKKYFLSFLALLFCQILLQAQNAPAIEWQKPLGGYGQDYAQFILQTTDGGFIVAGYSDSYNGDVSGNHGYDDYWIVKLDSNGNLQWQKCLGGSKHDRAYTIQQTNDGGFITVGTSWSNNGDVSGNHLDPVNNTTWDIWIVKLDTSGNIQWQKSLGGTDSDYGWSIQQTSNGGFIVAGSSESNDGDVSGNHYYFDCWIVRLDSSGSIEWQKSLGGSGWDQAYSIQQTADGGFIVAGYADYGDGDVSGTHGNGDYWIVKLDSSGNIQWQKALGGSDWDEALSIQQTTDGGFIVAGDSRSSDGDVSGWHVGYDYYYGNPTDDYWVVKLNSSGNIQWQKSLGGSGDDYATSIQQISDGAFIVGGWSSSNDGDVSGNHGLSDYWIVKLDTMGNLLWQKSFGGSAWDYATSIQKTSDGGFIVAGSSSSHDGDVSDNYNGTFDYWIVKLSPEIPLALPSIAGAKMFSTYPNPTNSNITITATFPTQQSLMIKLTDIIGREVLSFDEGLVSENFSVQHNLTALSSGTYFLKMIHDGISEVEKLQIEK